MYPTYQEKELAGAVIRQAIMDLNSPYSNERWAARRFFESQDLDFWAGFLEIDPDLIRERAEKLTKRSESYV